MAFEPGDIKVFNPNKEISREITLEILIRHRDALKQARTGELPGVSIENIKDNTRKINQVRALSLIIAAQREMITASRPMIWWRSSQAWKKKYKEEEEQRKNPFETFECDYKKLMEWLQFLKFCEQEIINAEKSKTIDDDFLHIKQTSDGEVYDITPNFRDMLEELESSYEQIYLLMLTNKIVSAGIEEDEEMTYKDQESMFLERFKEA